MEREGQKDEMHTLCRDGANERNSRMSGILRIATWPIAGYVRSIVYQQVDFGPTWFESMPLLMGNETYEAST